MIENPKVGQRVWCKSDMSPGTIDFCNPDSVWIGVRWDSGRHGPVGRNTVYGSRDAAAALREQASELIAAAEKLEQEEHHEPARPGGSLTAPPDKPPKTREP